ncbi:MAG: hypothetical protein R2686_06995 [Candidatus Nanopelagicales bacterium]
MPSSNGRGTKRRRDLNALCPAFLERELTAALPGYVATFYARNASIGRSVWDADDIEAELSLMLTDAATRFDQTKGTGDFAAWACNRQRTMLLDVSRAQMGRTVSDAAIAASRGETITADAARAVADFAHFKHPESLDTLPFAERHITTLPHGTAWQKGRPMTAADKKASGHHPDPRDLIDHIDKRVATAARKALAADERLADAWQGWVDMSELRDIRDRLKAELANVEKKLREDRRKSPKGGRLDAKRVRAWAQSSGVDCPSTGMIPRRVADAYRAAEASAG